MGSAAYKILAIAAVAALPALASAQLTANLSLTTNYKFRGQDQDMLKSDPNKTFKPAIQGGFDYAFADTGFYVGNWNSSVNWLDNNSIESDLYGGYKFTYGDFSFDVGGLAYLYPGAGQANTAELYGAGSWGPLTLKYWHTVSKDYFNAADHRNNDYKGRNTGYVNLAFAQEVFPKVTAKASVGYTNFSSDLRKKVGLPRYMDYSLGGAYDFGDGLSLGVAWAGANHRNFFGVANKNRIIATLTKTL